MFGVPVREGDSFYVPIQTPVALGGRFEIGHGATGLVPDFSMQSHFKTLQQRVLTELVSHKALFKKAPTLESLQAISPNWGMVLTSGAATWSPLSTKIKMDAITADHVPGYADCVLEGLHISRSTITPNFRAVFLEKAVVPDHLIDFEWGSGEVESDIEEVSDIELGAEEGMFELKDPATRKREKLAAKERIREALRAADAARAAAMEMADDFMKNYDLSDSESAFTEWMDSDEDDF
jgi:hypothetical protein